MGRLDASLAQAGSAQQQAPAVSTAIDPKVIAILRASCDTLSAAQTMTFTAVDTFERSVGNGQPLYYTVLNHVKMERPDKLRVLKLGDGIPNEFYYNGKTMEVYIPSADMVATADAPSTIDQMLNAAWNVATIYFPFAHVLVSKPCAILDDRLRSAFYVGHSIVVGGVNTDVVAVTGDDVQAELWIGVADHLPRMLREVYSNVPGHARYQTDYSDWHLDAPVKAGDFDSAKVATAKRVPFQPTAAAPPPSASPSPGAWPRAGEAPPGQPLPPMGGDSVIQWRAQRASIIGD
jgi:hypothetical protein